MRNLEQELKISLDAREYRILSQQTQAQPIEQVNYYFGSIYHPDKTLMVRLRQKNGAYLLCYKRRLTINNGITVSDERECEIEKNYAQTLLQRGITKEELFDFFQEEFPHGLYPLGKLTTFRTKFTLGEWTIELDKNIYFDHCDYELECENSQVQSLEKLKSYLTYTFGVVIRHSKTKFERFLEAYKTHIKK